MESQSERSQLDSEFSVIVRPAVQVSFDEFLRPKKLSSGITVAPWAIKIVVDPAVIAQSRRDGGLPHRFGRFQFNGINLNVLLLKSDDEVDAIVLPMSVPAVWELLEGSEAFENIAILMVDSMDDARVVLVSAKDFVGQPPEARPLGTFGPLAMAEAVVGLAGTLHCEFEREEPTSRMTTLNLHLLLPLWAAAVQDSDALRPPKLH
jgi:hypothetical protein